MNVHDLRERLWAEGIRSDVYRLNGEYENEALILEHSAQDWSVYYAERGIRTGEHRFGTEDEACRYMLQLLLKDPSARVQD
jgi:hypothetical protein